MYGVTNYVTVHEICTGHSGLVSLNGSTLTLNTRASDLGAAYRLSGIPSSTEEFLLLYHQELS